MQLIFTVFSYFIQFKSINSYMHIRSLSNSVLLISKLFAHIFTDVMSRSGTIVVILEVVPEDGQQRVVVLPHDHAVLPVVVVGLPLRPVEPAHRLVLVRPPPLTRAVLTVTILKIHLLAALSS